MIPESAAVELLVDRLAIAGLQDEVTELVLAAAAGTDALTACLGGEPGTRPAARTTDQLAARAVFVGEIAVEGFRGIAGSARLGLRPGPGLTLVVGRNGSGKSSFAEAAELALTGTASRWERRSKVWQEGWACLHHSGPRSIELKLVAEGEPGATVVRRRWGANDDLETGRSTAQRPGEPEAPLEGLGLGPALVTWRPFLPYNELGGLLDEGPSRLYDAISAVLGLEEWVEIEGRLIDARKALEATVKSARTEADRLREVLRTVADDRAKAAVAAMPARKPWDLDTVEAVATGAFTPASDLADVEALAALPLVSVEDISRRATELRAAVREARAVGVTDAGRARELADLLERALDVHEHSPGQTCPVCGTSGVLDEDWAARSRNQTNRLRAEAAAAIAAERTLDAATAVARGLVTPPPQVLSAPIAGVDTSLIEEVWRRWSSIPNDPHDFADHLDARAGEFAAAVEATREAAAKELRRRQDRWQPIAAQLASWLPAARAAQARQGRVAELKAASAWIADEANLVRNERFAPIADQVLRIWQTLRQTSNVALNAVTLEGTKTRRRVELTVSVDDVTGAALSVMSQGELHALALSLFLPRAMLPASPFRFAMIDDPVQAMDAARVDGLARVLSEAAATHQVIVFTHDARLPDACRRLDLRATVLEVSRGERSQVAIRPRRHPVDDYLADARAVLATAAYPSEARRRVVPGLCRNALEAACVDATRRRLLDRGRLLADIDEATEAAGKLLPRLALALFGEADRAGEVLAEINRRWGREAGDCVQALRTGAHQLIDGDPELLVTKTDHLAHAIDALT